MSTATQSLTLEEFLTLPETKPASEFINAEIVQKPMHQGEHSRLQGKLCAVINQVTEDQKIAYAFPELRCTFGGESVVPDVTVFQWNRIPWEPSGRVSNRFFIHPDWSIEILSSEHNQTKVLGNLLHCSQHGTKLGWLLDPAEESILVVFPDQRVQLLRGTTQLPIFNGIPLQLTVEQVFDWLSL
jgi:Uma2 family endonuclease